VARKAICFSNAQRFQAYGIFPLACKPGRRARHANRDLRINRQGAETPR
jgi:hypothetical protein